MSSGRKESVRRHINNPRIHDGRAFPIPYVEYLAGLQSGSYGPPTAYRYLRRNRSMQEGITVLTERTYLDKVQEKVAEKAIEKLADNAVGIMFEQNRAPLPTHHPNQQAFSVQGFSFSKEKIFGIGGYICRYCTTINAIIFTFSSQLEDFTSNCLQVPCLHQYNPIDTTNFNKHLQEKGLIEPLKDWIQNLWSNVPNFKVIAFEVPDPRILNGLGDIIANHEYCLTLGMCEGGNTGCKRTNVIHINYDDTLVEDISRTLDKYDASSLSCSHVNQTILNTIDKNELVLDSEAELESFLEVTKWRSFGFFRSMRPTYGNTRVYDHVYLIALFPVEFLCDRTIRVVSVDRKRPSDKSLPNSVTRKYPPSSSV